MLPLALGERKVVMTARVTVHTVLVPVVVAAWMQEQERLAHLYLDMLELAFLGGLGAAGLVKVPARTAGLSLLEFRLTVGEITAITVADTLLPVTADLGLAVGSSRIGGMIAAVTVRKLLLGSGFALGASTSLLRESHYFL